VFVLFLLFLHNLPTKYILFHTEVVDCVGSKKSGKIKSEYKRDYFHSNLDVDFNFAGPTIFGAVVFG